MKRLVSRLSGTSKGSRQGAARRVTFGRGFLLGLAAPAALFGHSMPTPTRSRAGLHSDWAAVGKDLSTAMKSFEKESA